MLCSISTHKSGSNWLDRLRSSKGIQSADPRNLEQFLTDPASSGSDSNSPHELRDTNNIGLESSSDPVRSLNEPAQTPSEPCKTGDSNDLCNVVSNVLSELFCMGESTTFPKFKGSRKQTNPRFCASSEINNATIVSESGDNSRVEIKDSKVKLLDQGHNLAEEEDKSQANLLGFSRTEVTVIDTSCAPWKFEKLLFRKKNVWKVRDKKSKMINVGKKKRKADVADEDGGGVKKQKAVCKFLVNDKPPLKDKLERTSDSAGQASKNKQGNLKLKKASSSVILIKSIPTSKKDGTGIAKNSLRPTQRQYQAQ